MNDLRSLFGKFAGQEVWVLGNGPSLWRAPLESIPAGRAIGCNRILKTHDCEYVLIVDDMVWQQERERIESRGANAIISDQVYMNVAKGTYPENKLYMFTSNVKAKMMNGGRVLHNGYLSGYFATEIACMMAAPGGRVVLAGMDLEYTDAMKESRQTHASGDERPNGACDVMFPIGINAICWLSEIASSHGVSVEVVGPSALLRRGIRQSRYRAL